jgi:hypothetical protein
LPTLVPSIKYNTSYNEQESKRARGGARAL